MGVFWNTLHSASKCYCAVLFIIKERHSSTSKHPGAYFRTRPMTHSKKRKNARQCQVLVSFSAQCLYWKRRITIVLWARRIELSTIRYDTVERSFHINVPAHTAPTRTPSVVPPPTRHTSEHTVYTIVWVLYGMQIIMLLGHTFVFGDIGLRRKKLKT